MPSCDLGAGPAWSCLVVLVRQVQQSATTTGYCSLLVILRHELRLVTNTLSATTSPTENNTESKVVSALLMGREGRTEDTCPGHLSGLKVFKAVFPSQEGILIMTGAWSKFDI